MKTLSDRSRKGNDFYVDIEDDTPQNVKIAKQTLKEAIFHDEFPEQATAIYMRHVQWLLGRCTLSQEDINALHRRHELGLKPFLNPAEDLNCQMR